MQSGWEKQSSLLQNYFYFIIPSCKGVAVSPNGALFYNIYKIHMKSGVEGANFVNHIKDE